MKSVDVNWKLRSSIESHFRKVVPVRWFAYVSWLELVCVAEIDALEFQNFHNRTKTEANFFYQSISVSLSISVVCVCVCCFSIRARWSLAHQHRHRRRIEALKIVRWSTFRSVVLCVPARVRQRPSRWRVSGRASECWSIRVFFGSTQGHTHKHTYKNSSGCALLVYVSNMCSIRIASLLFFTRFSSC